MLFTEYPTFLFSVCRLVFYSGILRVKFHPELKNVALLSRPVDHKWVERRCHLATFLVTQSALQCLFKKSTSLMESFTSWLSLFFLVASRIHLHIVTSKETEIVTYINALFQFDLIHSSGAHQQRRPLKIKFTVAVVYCGLVSAILFPFGFVYALHWTNPCKVSLVGYWLLGECRTPNSTDANFYSMGFIAKSVIFLVNHWLWTFSFNAAVFTVYLLNMLSVLVIHQFIER